MSSWKLFFEGEVEVFCTGIGWLVGCLAHLALPPYTLLPTPSTEQADMSENGILKLANHLCPAVDYFDGSNFFTSVAGQRRATPLLLCVVCIELSDFGEPQSRTPPQTPFADYIGRCRPRPQFSLTL